MRERARALASRPYALRIEEDDTTSGQPIYLLSHPELPGCMAQGASIEEATESLDDARFEYILSLLEDGQAIPEPQVSATTTSSFAVGDAIVKEWEHAPTSDFHSDVSPATKPLRRRLLAQVVLPR